MIGWQPRMFMLAMSVLAMPWPVIALGETVSGLAYNPFDKPQVLAKPPVSVAKNVEVEKAPPPPPLKGTLVSADTPMAIVDDNLLRIGQEHDGFRLVKVEEGAAVFERGGEEIRVVISESDGKVKRR